MSLNRPKVVVVMPAYNAAQTLRLTYGGVCLGVRQRAFESLTQRYLPSPRTEELIPEGKK